MSAWYFSPTMAELDIAYADGWSLWRLFSSSLPYIDRFLNFWPKCDINYSVKTRKTIKGILINVWIHVIINRILDQFFWRQEMLFESFDFNTWCRNKIADDNEKLCSRFRNTVFDNKLWFSQRLLQNPNYPLFSKNSFYIRRKIFV